MDSQLGAEEASAKLAVLNFWSKSSPGDTSMEGDERLSPAAAQLKEGVASHLVTRIADLLRQHRSSLEAQRATGTLDASGEPISPTLDPLNSGMAEPGDGQQDSRMDQQPSVADKPLRKQSRKLHAGDSHSAATGGRGDSESDSEADIDWAMLGLAHSMKPKGSSTPSSATHLPEMNPPSLPDAAAISSSSSSSTPQGTSSSPIIGPGVLDGSTVTKYAAPVWPGGAGQKRGRRISTDTYNTQKTLSRMQ